MFQHSRRLEVVGRERLRDARPHEGAHGADVGRQVVGGGVGEVVEKAGADQRAERRLAQLDRALDEVDRRDPILAVRAHVVADDEGAVRPADEHRPVEPQLVDDRRHVVGPELAVGVVLGLERRLGHAVAAEVVGHEPELVGERALVLLGPAEMVLRPAVDEQDRRPVRLAPLAHVQPQAAAAPHRVSLHPPGRLLRLSPLSSRASSCSSDRRDRGRRRSRSASGREPYLSPPALRIFRRRDAYERAFHRGGCAILAEWRLARARCSSDACASSGSSSARSTRRRREAARPSSSPGRRASARPGSRPSSRRAPATRGSRSSSGARSISSARSCRTSRSSRRCVRSESLAGRCGGGGLAAAGVRGDARAAHRARSRRARAARARGSALGRHLDARSRRVPRAQPRRPAGSAARDLPRGRALVGRAHAPARRRRPALGLGARARARAARATRSWRRCSRLAPTPLPAALTTRSSPAPRATRSSPKSSSPPPATMDGELPRGLRDLLLQRVARLDAPTQGLLRLAAAAGRDVGYALLRAAAARCRSATCASRCAGRSSTASSSPSRRPAASGSATRCWRRRSTRRSCPASARSCTRGSPTSSRAAERRRRRSSRRTGRRRVAATEALAASVEAARQAEAVFGLAEAHAHLERALALWDAVPDAAELAGLDLAELCAWAAELASQVGAAPRAVELGGERSSSSARKTRTARRSSTCGSASTCTRPAATTPDSPRSSARSSSCRRSRPRRSARRRWRRSRAG